jgi:hypothetical protein
MKAVVSIILIIILAFLGYLIYQKYYGKPTATPAADESGIPSGTPSGESGENKYIPKFAESNMQYYLYRIQNLKTEVYSETGRKAGDIIKKLDYDGAVNLLPEISQYESWFAEMKKAVATKENIEPEDYRPERPIPNYLAHQTHQKFLVVKGMALERQGNIPAAVDAYLLAAEFGGKFAGKNTILISNLIGIALEKIAYTPLKQFVINHPQKKGQMKRIIETLERIEQNRTPVSEALRTEQKCFVYFLDHRQEYAKNKSVVDSGWAAYMNITDAEVQQIKSDADKAWGFVISAAESPYSSKQYNIDTALMEMIKPMHPLVRVAIPNFCAANVRELIMATDNRLIRIIAAAQLYYADNNKYPNSLAELAPMYLTSVPKDYFSDADYIYFAVPASNTFYVYSVGPDMIDNKNQIVYDPTNGVTSPGDIRGK